jgi:hypothetical protein
MLKTPNGRYAVKNPKFPGNASGHCEFSIQISIFSNYCFPVVTAFRFFLVWTATIKGKMHVMYWRQSRIVVDVRQTHEFSCERLAE